jgi:diaminopropionate ammonia-lyase
VKHGRVDPEQYALLSLPQTLKVKQSLAMTSRYRRPLYLNPAARSWTITSSKKHNEEVSSFHNRLPNFAPTKLINLGSIAKETGVKAVYVKDESNRCGGRAFKILGASWAVFRAITTLTGLKTNDSLEEVSQAARETGIMLLAASAGNHGIAVASSAKLFGIKSKIYVSNDMTEGTRDAIRAEGAEIVVVQGGYDEVVLLCEKEADGRTNILIQDTAFEGYEKIPQVNQMLFGAFI